MLNSVIQHSRGRFAFLVSENADVHRCSIPHSSGDTALFGADRIGVNGSGGSIRMAKPTLEQIKRYSCLHGTYAETMPQALGYRVRPFDAGSLNRRFNNLPCTSTTERPRWLQRAWAGTFQIMRKVLHIHLRRRRGHGAKYVVFTLLECLKYKRARSNIDATRIHGKRFADAPRKTQDVAKGTLLARQRIGRFHEGEAFFVHQIKAFSGRAKQLIRRKSKRARTPRVNAGVHGCNHPSK